MTKPPGTALGKVRRLPAAAALLLAAGAVQGQNITKCQDAEGNWHYGDFAAEACAEDAAITEIDERGLQVRESEAPPTQEELDARQAAERQRKAEEERRAKQEAADNRLLQTYDSAQAIIEARVEKVQAVERRLDSHRLFRQDLVDEKQGLLENGGDSGQVGKLDQQIEQYDQAIRRLEEERRATIEKYNTDLARYRELTSG